MKDFGWTVKLNYYAELQGIARLKEALEANDWAAIDDEDDFGLDDFGDLEDEDDMGFGAEAAELEMEMFGMKRAIYEAGGKDGDEDGKGREREDDEDQEDEVEKLEALMLRMQAVRGE
jgi:Alpha and gamma adaptin binding protein p34